MAQNPKSLGNSMPPPVHQENRPSFRHPPPRPPPPPPPRPPSSTATDQLTKRVTRDLPNFSDCHGCRVRINYTAPSDRLQTLDSVWRVVLLCKKCIRWVNSGQTCPYCFKNTADSDCFECTSCKRHLHKDCVGRYGNSAPWSYSSREEGVEAGNFVCIDCWIPRFFRKSIGVIKKTQNYNGVVKPFEKSAKDANFEAKRKVVLALKAKDKSLRKTVVAKNALELVAKKDKSKGLLRSTSISSDDTNLTEVVNDADLAFQLHRVMNSSPRISKTLCPVNSSYVDAPELLEPCNVSCKSSDFSQTLPNDQGQKLKVYSRTRLKEKVGRIRSESPPGVIVYSRTRFKEKVDQTSSEASPCAKVYSHTRFKENIDQISSEAPPCVKVYSRSRFKEKVGQSSSEAPPFVKVYSRTRLKEKVCQTSLEAPPCAMVNGKGSRVDSGYSEAELITYKRRRLKSKTCEERVGLADLITEEHSLGNDSEDSSSLRFSQQESSHAQHRLHLQEAGTLCPLSSGGDNNVKVEICADNTMQADSCNVQKDRFLFKYSIRKRSSDPGSDVQEYTFPHPASDRSLPTNWSLGSRTSSNV